MKAVCLVLAALIACALASGYNYGYHKYGIGYRYPKYHYPTYYRGNIYQTGLPNHYPRNIYYPRYRYGSGRRYNFND